MTSNESAISSPPQNEAQVKPEYWRSLSELRGGDEFNQYLDREFPVAASEFPEGVSRRRWMQLMGASLAVVGASGCRYPEETIEPFVIRPEGRIPGESYSRATNFELAGRVYNLLVSCVDGRPLKIEPNLEHPSGLGTDVYSQASILGLYDPDRARGDDGFLIRKGEKRRLEVNWEEFDPYGAALIKTAESNRGGAGLAVLMSPTSSPSLVRMLQALQQRLPKATICSYDGVEGDAMQTASSAALGKSAKQVLALDKADVIVAIQADILGNDKNMMVNAARFAQRRDPTKGKMNRLYVVEGGYSSTGAAADSRLAIRPSQMRAFLSELARRVEKIRGGQSHDAAAKEKPFDQIPPDERLERFLEVVAHDVAQAGEKAVIVVGDHLGSDAIVAGMKMNQTLGSFGGIQKFSTAVDADLPTVSLRELTNKIDDGEIDTLLVLGNNPVATAPGDIDLGASIAKVENTLYHGEYDDETALACEWSLPMSHPLESWGDCVNPIGHYGVCQPQILPLLGGRAAIELLAMLLGERETDGGKIVRRTADEIAAASLSDRQWRQLLHDGFADDLVLDSGEMSVGGDAREELTSEAPFSDPNVDTDLVEVIFVPADGIYDGRFANNGWLQEMPQSLTKLTWDNAAVMSPSTAAALGPGIRHGKIVALTVGDSTVELPIYEMPGCAPGVVTATIGYGRGRAGMVGGYTEKDVDVVGTDVSPIRQGDGTLIAYDVKARPRYEDYELSTTQDHWAIDERGRDETEIRSFKLVREGTTELFEKVPQFAESKGPHVPKVGENGSPWREPIDAIEEEKEKLPQWGMAIDLNKCIGCSACVIACQSENNIPIVGREQVLNSREMHWLRIDRYFQGDEDNANVVQEPMACQHCETAPCEQVCPVAATVHTDEGINAMAYNRCIGTRYCANNCPFKVRRFNYFNYNEEIGTGYGIDAYAGNIESANRKLQALVMNPEVTVRGRGVMEKCTYCVQRVEAAKITARKEDRAVADGDVVTACQSACPTRAIEFGSIADPKSTVSKKFIDPRTYGMLGQLNIKPRTRYLARIRNTPKRLMTAQQLEDLATIEPPHHGDHGGHQSHGDHGQDDHGDDHGHGNEDHGNEAHGEDSSHEQESHASQETQE